MTKKQWTVWPGGPYPLGATWDGEGVNFAIFSEHAEKVELCLFDSPEGPQTAAIPLTWQTDLVWHCYLPEAKPGLLYGYRVYGPYESEKGHRFNPKKFLLDPYAKNLEGEFRWHDALFGYKIGEPEEDLSRDDRDSAQWLPKCKVADISFDWGDDQRPCIPWHQTIIYELHVKGFTKLHPQVPADLRGTYAGLASVPVIQYLKRLGVTTVELLPVHSYVDERPLVDRGLRNYWGYNSICYFAPERRHSATGRIREFKEMVKAFHAAGLEIILDVVYNHTAEGNQLGPTLCFRGIDNASYYRLKPESPRYYTDFTGCGNTLNMMHPRVLQLIMDSLRYWVTEMHVDGFRFDLASALAREFYEVDKLAAFFDVIHQDPVISQVKLIAEPWDLGEGGYQVGNFPVGWTEWNGKYRDTVRAYWKGEGGLLGELAYRLTGSSDLYDHSGRRPYASINFVTCHDGFTLEDLVSYNEKHNEANKEENNDGSDYNISWNCGVEGPTGDPEIRTLRNKQKRNFLATLMFSVGVPMLLAGDEIGNSQSGNNNAYCQDNELSWLDWDLSEENKRLLAFVRRLIKLRKEHPVFRRRYFLQGRKIKGAEIKDILWLTPDGKEMTDEQWTDPKTCSCLGFFLAGAVMEEYGEHGEPVHDDDLVIMLNHMDEEVFFKLSFLQKDTEWQVAVDTSEVPNNGNDPRIIKAHQLYPLQLKSLAMLVQLTGKPAREGADAKKA